MNRIQLALGLLCLTVTSVLCPRAGQAQMEEDLIPASYDFVSPANFAVEFRFGAYRPDPPGFKEIFEDEFGPLLELELDYFPLHLPKIAYIGVGAKLGYAGYAGGALLEDGQRASEDSEFDALPITLLAVGRLDILPRRFSIPLIFTAKIGYTWLKWDTSTGDVEDASGWSNGLHYAAQFALDLDTFEPAGARTLDEEFGLNHSFLFLELWGFSAMGDSLELDDSSWVAGLGFIF